MIGQQMRSSAPHASGNGGDAAFSDSRTRRVRSHALGYLALITTATACTAADLLGTRLTPTAEKVLAEASADVGVLTSAGCSIARELRDDGSIRVITLRWSALQILKADLPDLPVGAASKTLHIVGRADPWDPEGSSAVICAVPLAREFDDAVRRLGPKGGDLSAWAILEELLARKGRFLRGTAREVALSELRSHLKPTTKPQLPSYSPVSHAIVPGVVNAPPTASIFGQWTNTWQGVEAARDLGTVWVYGTPDTWTWDNHFMRDDLALFHKFNSANWGATFVLSGPECAEASALYILAQEEGNQIEEEGEMINTIEAALANFTCQLVDGSKTLCVDFFIRDSRAIVFEGDNRDFDPWAGWRSSRVQLYFNPDAQNFSVAGQNWEVKFNESHLLFCGQWCTDVFKADSGRTFKPDSDVVINRMADSIRVTVKFRNTFCPSRDACPAIDASLTFWRDASAPAGWRLKWLRDGFPAMGVYKLDSQDPYTISKIAEDKEQVPPGYSWAGLAGLIRSVSPPPECPLQ
jgi:hypothetical protein